MEILATTVNEAAKALSLGRTSIYALIKEGRLETVKLGRRTLVKAEMESVKKLAVPLVVDVGVGDNWRDAK